MDTTKFLEAYTRIKSFKENLQHNPFIEEPYIIEYHSMVDLIEESTGFDLTGFRVPTNMVKPRVTSTSYKGKTYSDELYCERPFVIMKVDAVLSFFQFQASSDSPKRPIGFKPPGE